MLLKIDEYTKWTLIHAQPSGLRLSCDGTYQLIRTFIRTTIFMCFGQNRKLFHINSRQFYDFRDNNQLNHETSLQQVEVSFFDNKNKARKDN